MKKKVLFLVIIFIFIILLGNFIHSKNNQLSKREKIDDFKYVYNIIKNDNCIKKVLELEHISD
ncbi:MULTISPECIES: hypothetical protein [unclassified Clostridioides]|uniref:hypothetical protein n=1 Tax=unclassified Clostridioides TaxID=2635829 RepID=UPI001D0FB23D